tara:strand:- start:3483 stop:4151 length:669 start_codon:yes stop_codon:yes gene_type:complete
MSISVVIRTKNEERWIGHTIQSIIDMLDYPEIIIIDNNSTDRTLHIVKRFQYDPEIDNKNSNYTKINIYKTDNYSPGKALNEGVNHASNDKILIISSHCVLKEFNAEKHLKSLDKHICVFGKQIPIWEGRKITKRYIWSHFTDREEVNMYSDFESRHFLHNACALYNKRILIDHPFDEKLVGKEDRYWANDRVNEGLTYLYDPEMVVEHHYTPNGNTWKGIG